MKRVLTAVVVVALVSSACEKKPNTPAPAAPAASGTGAQAPHGHGGPVIELGTITIGPYSVQASRDQGEIKAGGDAAIDVRVTGDGPKVAAVRFWIGTQDSTASIKARAEIENPKEPNHWHTHAEVPDPLPAGSQLWVEIEDEKGVKSVGSFGLKG